MVEPAHRAVVLASIATLAALTALGACGIADDTVPRDIDPARLESLKPTP
jgi:hypothetical protein